MINLSTDDIGSGIEDIVRIGKKKICNSIYYIGHECWLFIDTYDTSNVKLIPSLKGAYQLILNI
jgi:hypothetical protein